MLACRDATGKRPEQDCMRSKARMAEIQAEVLHAQAENARVTKHLQQLQDCPLQYGPPVFVLTLIHHVLG
jgi:hypothetical protein